ncbi:MAG TPA: CaiB/BaiF CoA-transferase family protein, partial [Bacillota bacterium]|nr:CaiB/BaiF CoA-transferase family protein [Bacillota bacterium]
AYDIIIQAMSGLMSITGPGPGQPTRVGTSIADLVAALFTVIGILAALNDRNRTGLGQMVDVAMLDCQLALLENALARYFATGEDPVPLGNRHPSITPFSSFNAADGQFVLAMGNNSLWQTFCNAVARPALLEDPRFADNASRTTHWAELHQILEELFRTKTVAEWLELLGSHGIPCGPINTISAVASDPHVQERGMVVELVDQEAGPVKMAGLPIKFSRSRCTIDKPAPGLGAHTVEVLSSLARHGHNTDKT